MAPVRESELFTPMNPGISEDTVAGMEFNYDELQGSYQCPIPPTEGSALRLAVAENEPPFCECARVAKRPLSWGTWSDSLSRNSTLDEYNKEYSHSHIIFEGSGDNIGFGPGFGDTGLFAEDYRIMDYHFEPECYDGSKMRAAVRSTEPPSFFGLLFNNCQSYVERLLNKLRQ